MSVIQIELDDETLAAAMRLSGARTEAEAVSLVLRDYVTRHRPTPDPERSRRSRGWDHDGWGRRRETGGNPPPDPAQ